MARRTLSLGWVLLLKLKIPPLPLKKSRNAYNKVKNQVRNGRVAEVPFYFLHFIVLMMGEHWGGGCSFMVFSFSFGDLEGGWVEFFFFWTANPPIPHFILKIEVMLGFNPSLVFSRVGGGGLIFILGF